jgi:ribosomal protein S18 acetylase RimI-like enzyme
MQGSEEAHRCAELMAGSQPWITLQRSYERCLKAVNDPIREVYVAVEENEFLGFVILALRGPFSGYIQSIAVAEGRRNCGIGRKLIAFSEELILRQSPNIFLCVSSFNSGAQRFYARLGYEQVGELRDYVVRGHSEILMRKSLGPIAEFTAVG